MSTWEYEEMRTPRDIGLGSLRLAMERYKEKHTETPSLVLYGDSDEEYVKEIRSKFLYLTFVSVHRFVDQWMVIGAEGAVGSGGV